AAALAAGPDPETAAAYLARFASGGGEVPNTPDAQALLAGLLGNGGYLADLLLAEPRQFAALLVDPHLVTPKPRAQLLAEAATACAEAHDLPSLQRGLRRFARQEMLRLGAREVALERTLEVATELSALADAALEQAVRVGSDVLEARHGRLTGGDRAPGFVVLGMGKLGGEELNFSSDVDLIYLYATDDGEVGTTGRLSPHEHYVRLSQFVTRALDERTEDGMVFRVDLRLRPEGRSGAICNSLAATLRYYETFGRTWERQALLRARPVAGDLALGEEFLRAVTPFVYPRSLDPQMIDDVLSLRGKFRAGAEGGGFNVKLGDGGIRDVELVAQLLQLLHGGKRAELRVRGTLLALQRLTLAGLLTDREQRALGEAYRFLRRVEHRVQLEQGGQVHSVPDDEAGRQRLARRLGFATAGDFDGRLNQVRETVLAVSRTLGEPAGAVPPEVIALLDPALSRGDLEAALAALGFLRPAASADVLETVQGRLPAAWLVEVIASPGPDAALARFAELARRGSLGLHALLRDQPQLLRMLAGLFGTSARLSHHLLRHPAVWQPLLTGIGEPRPTRAALVESLAPRLEGLDQEQALREMRRYQAEEVLRIGIHDVGGNLSAGEVSAQLTAVAEACLGATVSQVADQLAARYGRPDAGLAVLGLGSLGARALRYGSDLDLVFLFSDPGTTAEGMDHQEWFARLAQRAINALGARLDEGSLYEVDTRLRPSGAQGLLVTSFAGFARYHEVDAALWERVALLRARPVCTVDFGAPGRAAAITALWKAATYGGAVDPEALRTELLRMRARIENERAKPVNDTSSFELHLRFSPGGLADLEFLIAFWQLSMGRDEAQPEAVRSSAPDEALAALIAQGHLTEPALLDDHAFLQGASLRLRLLRQGGDETTDDRLTAADFGPLARSLGMSESGLKAALGERMARVRRVFTSVVGVPR
ncbi:MAG TPA: bifunctional [glutamate--ammonia ligase]-adenylyl-L-tyrosine phosphorylase/[glutamate--ammonia-ligase] adenylyltransferase, partial [Polyangia bacterium]